jgi:hypothetical protein
MKTQYIVYWLPLFAMSILAGCSTMKPASSFEDPNGNFHLTVYMDSYRYAIVPMDVKVWIDDRVAVDRNFSSRKGQHDDQFRFALAPGAHILRAVTHKGNSELVNSFEIKDRLFGVLYFTPSSAEGKGNWQFRVSPEPIYVSPGGGI